jgi:hypothetical protein
VAVLPLDLVADFRLLPSDPVAVARGSHCNSASIYGGSRPARRAAFDARHPRQLEQVGRSSALPTAADKASGFKVLDGTADQACADAKRHQLPVRGFELAVAFAAVTEKFSHQEYEDSPCRGTQVCPDHLLYDRPGQLDPSFLPLGICIGPYRHVRAC